MSRPGPPPGALPAPPPVADTLSAIRARGTLRVGLALFVPRAMHDRGGRLVGFDVDVARQLAADIGVAPRFVLTSWPDLTGDLERGRYDVIISGMVITPERALAVNFSKPYAVSSVTLLANRRRVGRRSRAVDFDQAGVVLGVRARTISAGVAAARFPRATVEQFEDDETALAALLDGRLTALVAASPLPALVQREHAAALVLPLREPLARLADAFAVRKGDADFVDYLDAWVRFYRGTEWLAERLQYWFGSTAWLAEQ